MFQPSKDYLKKTVLDAARYIGKFDPLTYSEKYRAELIAAAEDLCTVNKLHPETINDRTVYFQVKRGSKK